MNPPSGWTKIHWAGDLRPTTVEEFAKEGTTVNNIFYIIGVVVVVLFVLGYFGLR